MSLLRSLIGMLAFAALPAAASPLPEWASESPAAAIDWTGTTEAPLWSDTFGTPDVDWVNGVRELSGGDMVAVGFVNRGENDAPPSWDLVARRYSGSGELLWSRRLGGPGIDAGWGVVETADGGIAIAGASAGAAGGVDQTDVWLLVLDAEGQVRVDRRFGGPAEDFATGLTATADGGFLISGWTQSMGAGGRDVLLVRTDAEGRELWRRAYGGPDADRGFYVRPAEGGYVVAGVTGAPDSYDFLLMKVDDRGEMLWRRTVGGPANDPTHGLIVRPDGRILLIGYSRSWESRDYDLATLTFSAQGELLRHEMIGAPGDDRAQFAALGEDGSVWVTGYTRSFSGGDWDILVARIRPDGSFEPWLGAIASPGNDNGSAIALARNGDLLVSGYSAAPSGGREPPDGFVMRLRPDSVVRKSHSVEVRAVPLAPNP